MKRMICLLFVLLLTACSTVTTQEVPKYELGKSENVPLTEEEYFQELQTANGGTSLNESPSKHTTEEQLISSTQQPSQTQEVSFEGARKVTVTTVIDGDTIKYLDPSLGGQEVTGRLLGLNSPEWTKEKQPYGDASTEFLTNLILGQTIEIVGDDSAGEMDKYGRYLIHAAIGGKSIQQQLIIMGLARVAYLYGEYMYVDMYKEAENIAKESGLNIWSIQGYVDDKNGFNVEVITKDIADQLKGELKEKLSDKLLEKVSELQKLIK
jgi:micrococcal nuclease